MIKVKNEPHASLEGICDFADGDGDAVEIGGKGSPEEVVSGSIVAGHEARSMKILSSEPDTSTVLPNQLTIFFGGRLTVFDGLPAEKVQEILLIAAKAMETKNCTTITPVPSPALNRAPSSASTSNGVSPTPQSFPIHPILSCRSVADLPIARRHSLQRFLEKRRDRMVNKNPYPTSDIKKTDVPIGNDASIKEECLSVSMKILSSDPDTSTVLPNQLTIFFGGRLTVFDALPAEKVQEILLIASKAMETKNCASITPVPSPALNRVPFSSSTSNGVSPTSQSFSVQPILSCRSVADLPIARRHSLQRFLEKRRDRLVNKDPYPTSDIKKTDVPMGNASIKEEYPTV